MQNISQQITNKVRYHLMGDNILQDASMYQEDFEEVVQDVVFSMWWRSRHAID